MNWGTCHPPRFFQSTKSASERGLHSSYNKAIERRFSMKNTEKLTQVLQGILCIVLGVLIAIFRGEAVLRTYFGIVLIVVGVLMLGFQVFLLAKKLPISIAMTMFAPVLIALGIGLLTEYLNLGLIIGVAIVGCVGLGAGLVLLGGYALYRHQLPLAIAQICFGAIVIVLASLYIANVPNFQTIFWIIIGIIVALYGLLTVIYTFVEKPKLKK